MAYDKVVDSAQLDADLKVVADAIRSKSGTTEQLSFPQGMKQAVEDIQTGVTKPEQEKTIDITENGTTEVLPDSGKVLSKVTVNVEVESGGGSEETKGIKFLEWNTAGYGTPVVVDVRNIQQPPESVMVNTSRLFYRFFDNASTNASGGYYTSMKTVYLPDWLQYISTYMFNGCGALQNIYGDLTGVINIQANAFMYCKALKEVPYMPNLNDIGTNGFAQCTSLEKFCFYKTPTGTINATSFNGCTNLKDIYVPWAEGEVANAPWGATNATIHYNTTYDENHNPIV